jgi:pyruvate dehydrogenase E1 component alpha subunit
VAFFGDGAVEQGAFQESLAFAALRKLPVIFSCENNFYATYSPLSARQVSDNIHLRGESFGVPGARVDGNDVIAVYQAAREAVERARKGEGPTLLELRTYRWRDHVGPGYDIALGYRAQEELDTWMARCPILTFVARLEAAGVLSADKRVRIDVEIEALVDDAVRFAKASPWPTSDELGTYVY